MKLSPGMIREQRFKKRFRGYDRQEVITFLLDISDDMEALIEENTLLKGEIEAMKRRQGEIEELLFSIRQFSDDRLKKAEAEAAEIVSKAQAKAAEILQAAEKRHAETEQKAQEMLAQAMRRAKETLRDAERSRQELERSIEEIAKRRSELLAQVHAAVESCHAWLQTHMVQ